MKAYTDIEQSKRLAEILPIESADMCWAGNGFSEHYVRMLPFGGYADEICPCWSLSALLAQMPCITIESSLCCHYRVEWKCKISEWHESAIDACVELLLRVK